VRGEGSGRRDVLLLCLFSAALFLPGLGGHDLWNPNEPVYGRAVVEMERGGDWLVPRVNGLVFPEKPILYYWAALVASKIAGGPSEGALRIPSALAGILSVAAAYLLARRCVGARRARIAAVLLATTHMIFLGSRTIQMDVLVEASTLVTILAASRALDGGLAPRAAMLAWLAAGIAAGLGFLAKGPVAWICPAVVLAAYAVATRRPRALVSAGAALAAAAAIAVAVPWLAMLWARGETAFLEEMLLRQNVTRFVDPWDHAAPWWYFLRYYWIDMAPWAAFTPLALAIPGRADRERRFDTLSWCWIASIVVFFSLSASKRSPYILPVAPAVAFLASGVLERFLDDGLEAWRRRAVVVLVALHGLAFGAAALVLWRRVLPRYPEAGSAIATLALTLAAGLLAVAAGFAVRRRGAPLAGLVASLVALYLVVATVALPAADAFKSARPFCERLDSLASPEDTVVSWDLWRWRASYSFYSERPIRNLKSADELRRIWSGPERAFVVVEGAGLDGVRSVVGDAPPLVERRIGRTTAYLFGNEAAVAPR
jgi:4-amino-4-deoxy-L-arabinose transferase